MAGPTKLPDPRAFAKFLRVIAASPVTIRSVSWHGLTLELDGPAKSAFPGLASPRADLSQEPRRPSAEEETEAWDMVGDSVLPGLLGEGQVN